MDNTATVLVIDDEPTVLLALEALLQAPWVEAKFALSGEEGLELAKKHKPDAILLDVMMPDIDGFEVCRRLRADPILAETHIIMLTALDDRASKLAGLNAGADDFLVKPFDGLELQIRLNTIRQTSRYRRLNSERARFAWIVEQSEDGYMLLSHAGEIQYANHAAEVLLHLPENFQGTQFSQHAEKFYQPHPVDIWIKWFAYPENFYLVQPETSASAPFWIMVECIDAPISAENQRLVRLRNVTQNMIEYHDMRRFHTLITHKLRTPVSLIFMSMSLLKETINDLSMEEIRKMVLSSWKGSERLVEEIRDVLTYMDATAMRNYMQESTIQEFVEKIWETSKILEIKKIAIHTSNELRGANLKAPISALETILYEVLENAKKFHPNSDPTIDVEIEKKQDNTAHIKISDDGITLTPQQISWAWLPYFQSEKGFTGEVPGMGLGFPIAATLVWQSGGKISLKNRTSGVGIVVDITFQLNSGLPA